MYAVTGATAGVTSFAFYMVSGISSPLPQGKEATTVKEGKTQKV